jgi:iron-sulfur cluster assembly accessory protein
MTQTLQQDIMLSPAAAARVARIAQRQQAAAILRLSVEGGGCAGFQYKFGLAEGAEAGDTLVETDGVRLVVDEMSLDLVRIRLRMRHQFLDLIIRPLRRLLLSLRSAPLRRRREPGSASCPPTGRRGC